MVGLVSTDLFELYEPAMSLSIEETLANTPGAIREFERTMAAAPPAEEKGVLFSGSVSSPPPSPPISPRDL